MKIKSSLIAVVLAMMVLCAGNIGFGANAASNQAQAASASFEPAAPNCATDCFNNYIACKNACNGDPVCLAECHDIFDCCRIMCHGQECD